MIPLIPFLPEGSLLYSALAFSYRASSARNSRRFVDRFYGHRGASRLNWFGAGAEFVSSRSFNGVVSPVGVLRHNTLFGYYSLGLSTAVAGEWATELANGCARRSARYTRTQDPVATKTGLRWCLKCAVEDEARGELATWRVAHQLPFFQHCHRHLEPLVHQCPRCEEPLDDGRKFRLPGDECSVCGCTGAAVTRQLPSAGYFSLLTRADASIRQQVDTYRPINWIDSVGRFVSHYKSPEIASETLSRHLCSLWETKSLDQIWEQLGLRFWTKNLIEAITGAQVSSPLTLQLVAADAMQNLQPMVLEPRIPAGIWNSSYPNEVLPTPSERNVVLRCGTALNLPRRFLDSLLESGSPETAASSAGISRRKARKAVAELRSLISTEFGKDASLLLFKSLFRSSLNRSAPAVNEDDRLSRARARVLELLSTNQCTSRVALWKRIRRDMTFLRTVDRAWLERVLPASLVSGIDDAGRTQRNRSKVTSALDERPTLTRTALRERLPAAVAWLRARDKAWLDGVVPVRRTGKRSTN